MASRPSSFLVLDFKSALGDSLAATIKGGQRGDHAILVAKEGDYGACKLLGDIRVRSWRNVTSIGTTKPVVTAFVAKTFDNNKKRFNNNYKGYGSNSNSNNRGPNPNLKCTNCNKLRHTIDRCFELVGYPAGYVKKNFNSNTRPMSSSNTFADVHSNGVSSDNATTNNSLVSLSNEQLARLMNLLNNNGVSTANSNMAAKKVVGVGRGVKEKSLNMSKTNTGIGLSTASYGTRKEVGPVGDTSTVMEDVTPFMIDMTVEKDKLSSLEDITVPESFPPLTMPVTTTAGNAPGKSSYANIAGKPSGKKVNVRTLFTPEGNKIDVVVLEDSIRAISKRFANIAYGFFLGMKVSYPVVVNYVRNTWGKYGFVRSMFSSSTGLFSFQFSSMDGLDAMLENGLWFIRNNPLILKKWHPDENLLKEDVSTVPVWVKLHGVPVMTFNEDGLLAIFTKLGKLMMLDNDGNPLVPMVIMESDSEVEVLFDEIAKLRISTSGKDESDRSYGM
nr:hypothetical protein [Tanacetum cinerariifolium]